MNLAYPLCQKPRPPETSPTLYSDLAVASSAFPGYSPDTKSDKHLTTMLGPGQPCVGVPSANLHGRTYEKRVCVSVCVCVSPSLKQSYDRQIAIAAFYRRSTDLNVLCPCRLQGDTMGHIVAHHLTSVAIISAVHPLAK